MAHQEILQHWYSKFHYGILKEKVGIIVHTVTNVPGFYPIDQIPHLIDTYDELSEKSPGGGKSSI